MRAGVVAGRARCLGLVGNPDGPTTATSAATRTVAPPESITLRATSSMVVYGRTTTLVGRVFNGQPGQSIQITQRKLPPVGGASAEAIATVMTGTNGAFRLTVRLTIRTLFRASDDQTKSTAVSVRVRPLLRLTAIAPHRFLVRGGDVSS